jgi:NADH dehydrogenase
MLEDSSTLDYDGLIVAASATHSYCGHPERERDAPGLKTLADAFEIRRARNRCSGRHHWLIFVVVGAGATGVEMAGTMAEIVLLEGGDRVLPAYVPELSASARHQLEKLGVTLRLTGLVSAVDAEGVTVNGQRRAACTVIWAAGLQASPLGRTLGAPLDRAGRVVIEPVDKAT